MFLTGSDTSANALFGNLQVITANQIGLNPVLTASVNSAAGVMGKMISLPSIAVAGRGDGPDLRRTRASCFASPSSTASSSPVSSGIVAMLFAYVFPALVPVPCRPKPESQAAIEISMLFPSPERRARASA